MRVTQDQIELFIAALEVEGKACIAHVNALKLGIKAIKADNPFSGLIEPTEHLAEKMDGLSWAHSKMLVTLQLYSRFSEWPVELKSLWGRAREREGNAKKYAQEMFRIPTIVESWSEKTSSPAVAEAISKEFIARTVAYKAWKKTAEAWGCLRESLP